MDALDERIDAECKSFEQYMATLREGIKENGMENVEASWGPLRERAEHYVAITGDLRVFATLQQWSNDGEIDA